MATIAKAVQPQSDSSAIRGYPEGGRRFDWTMIALACLFVAGLWVDGWAHFHGQVDDSFFTPWHFLFYSSFGIVATFIAYHQWRNSNQGYAFRRALPKGYWLSLIGVGVFAVGGVGDMIWHTLFGIEGGSEALTSPTHMMLGVGMMLIASGALRAAWQRAGEQQGWRALGPTVISMTLITALMGFFTSYAHPLVTPLAANFFSGDSGASQTESLNQVYSMNPDGSLQTRLTADPAFAADLPAISPDGKRIAYTSGAAIGDEGENDLYVMNVDGRERSRLTEAEGAEFAASWSPDGKQIAYIGTSNGQRDIYIIPADGGEAKRLTDNPEREWSTAWSPDGKQIAYTVQTQNSANIYLMNADGTGASALTTDGKSWWPKWSPDGSQLGFTWQSEPGNFEAAVMNADGSHTRSLTRDRDFDSFGAFSPDGKQAIVTSWRSGGGEVYVVPITGENDTTPAVNISNNSALTITSMEWSDSAGKIIFVARGRDGGNSSISVSPQDFGVASFLLQAGLLFGCVVVLVGRWKLPFGAITLMFTLNALLLTLLADMFFFIPGALIAGLAADILIWRWKLAPDSTGRLLVFAFVVPVIYNALYFLTLQLAVGINWNIHVWAGAIVLSGAIAALLSSLWLAARGRGLQTA